MVDRLESHEQAQIIRVSEPTVGRWDRLRLDQVLTNLVSNALKCGEGRPIQITVKSDGADALLEVSDQGIGIPAEHQERIFERFERVVADPALRRLRARPVDHQPHRAGVRRVAVGARSEPGSSSTFIVRLPKTPTPTAPRMSRRA